MGAQSFRSISLRFKTWNAKGLHSQKRLEMISFRSKKVERWKSDTKIGVIRIRSFLSPCEQAMRCRSGPKNGAIRILP